MAMNKTSCQLSFLYNLLVKLRVDFNRYTLEIVHLLVLADSDDNERWMMMMMMMIVIMIIIMMKSRCVVPCYLHEYQLFMMILVVVKITVVMTKMMIVNNK